MENTENKKMKKTLIITLVTICIIGVAILSIIKLTSQNNKPSNNPKIIYNKNKEIIKDKKVDNLSFTNISCEFNGTDSNLTYTIINNSKEKIHLNEYTITLKNKNGDIIANINPNYNIDLNAGEKFSTTNSINVDLTKATTMEIKLNTKKET